MLLSWFFFLNLLHDLRSFEHLTKNMFILLHYAILSFKENFGSSITTDCRSRGFPLSPSTAFAVVIGDYVFGSSPPRSRKLRATLTEGSLSVYACLFLPDSLYLHDPMVTHPTKWQ